MRLVFSGLEHPVELVAGETSVLQVENSALFARIVASFAKRIGAPGDGALFPLERR